MIFWIIFNFLIEIIIPETWGGLIVRILAITLIVKGIKKYNSNKEN